MPSGADVQSTAAVWQGPVVRNEETGASILLFFSYWRLHLTYV